jgi:two-component system OmpR family response regulator
MAILIVDDDPRLRDLVRLALERAGHATLTAADGRSALIHAARGAPEMIVLDVGLPDMDGFEICRRLRATSDVPILFLTARDDEIDRILGLELGADDYVTKPFSPRELAARVKAILKRSGPGGTARPLAHGAIRLDPGARACRVGASDVALTGTEFRILELLLAQPARLLPRLRLVEAIWGAGSPVSDRTLDSHLRNLRAKLAAAGAPEAIETLHGQGLRLTPALAAE